MIPIERADIYIEGTRVSVSTAHSLATDWWHGERLRTPAFKRYAPQDTPLAVATLTNLPGLGNALKILFENYRFLAQLQSHPEAPSFSSGDIQLRHNPSRFPFLSGFPFVELALGTVGDDIGTTLDRAGLFHRIVDQDARRYGVRVEQGSLLFGLDEYVNMQFQPAVLQIQPIGNDRRRTPP